MWIFFCSLNWPWTRKSSCFLVSITSSCKKKTWCYFLLETLRTIQRLVLLLLFSPFYHAEQKHRSTKISSLCPKQWCLKGIRQRKGGIFFLSSEGGLLESTSAVLFTWTVEAKQCWKEQFNATPVILPLCFNICPLSATPLPRIQKRDKCWRFRFISEYNFILVWYNFLWGTQRKEPRAPRRS